ncbi:type IV pilus twitching motility protein PilT [Desulfofalx alkaliphila]|uniref:type IV pilus twitching motility protein PilT n=1 Tax=Desulfofalx alkaliphila TaxID=105483 RepID=UPI0004E10851|nr:type IV pilus twitching motility protein PilT [Desulfofalx alkaliphila]
MHIDKLLTEAYHRGASDVHITASSAPVFRLNGLLQPLEGLQKLTPKDTDALARQLMTPEQYNQFISAGDLDFAYQIAGLCRFRVNVYKQSGSVALAVRLINLTVPSLEELGLPQVLGHLSQKARGLVLITGPTGSGKSTTLASMIDLINNTQHCHIITLEDPIEFIHNHKKSIINQREVGRDTASFTQGLRAAMREDPDVILVGEMRDPETIATAITAAETGHLVLGTLHTSSAAQTVDRIIDSFPPHQQQQIRVQLANTIQGVVAQQLIPRMDRPGRVAALEIMVATPAIRNLIREGKTYQILSQIQTGAKHGMQTLDLSLKDLYSKGIISRDEMLKHSVDSQLLERML